LDQPRHADGTFASHSLEAVYAEIKRLDQLRTADQVAVIAALASAEKAVAAALAASEKAVAKAEVNQAAVNEGQNEFRGALRDQAASLMPRAEVESLIREIRVLIEGNAAAVRAVATTQRADTAKDATVTNGWKYLIAAGTLLIGAAGVILTIIEVTK
jgi:hypothetical protein